MFLHKVKVTVVPATVLLLSGHLANAEYDDAEKASLSTHDGLVSLWDAVQLAQNHDENLVIASDDRQLQLYQERRALAQLLPQISAYATRTNKNENSALGNIDNGMDQVNSLSVRQTIWNAESYGFNKIASHRVKAAKLDQKSAQNQSILDVTERYFNLLLSQSSVLLAQSQVDAINEHKKTVDIRASINESTVLDVVETNADLDLAKISLIQAQNDLIINQEFLAQFLAPLRQSNDLHESLQLLPVDQDAELHIPGVSDITLEEWLSTAYENNQQLQKLIIAENIRKQELMQARQALFPTVDLVYTWRESTLESIDFSGNSVDNKSDVNSIELSLSIPLFSGGARYAAISQAKVALNQAASRIVAYKKQLRSSVINHYQSMERLKQRIVALRSAVESQYRKLDATQEGFRQNFRTSSELLAAQQQFFQAELNVIEALHGYLSTALRLQQTAGILALQHVRIINDLFIR